MPPKQETEAKQAAQPGEKPAETTTSAQADKAAAADVATSSPLFQIGAWLVKAWWDGMVSNWSAVVSWLQGAVSSLLDLVPDGLKARLGLDVSAKAAPPTGQSTGAGAVPPTGQPTGAGAVLDGGAAKPGGQAEQKVTTEVVIKGENLPPGMTVAAPASQADRTNIDLGYSMAGA